MNNFQPSPDALARNETIKDRRNTLRSRRSTLVQPFTLQERLRAKGIAEDNLKLGPLARIIKKHGGIGGVITKGKALKDSDPNFRWNSDGGNRLRDDASSFATTSSSSRPSSAQTSTTGCNDYKDLILAHRLSAVSGCRCSAREQAAAAAFKARADYKAISNRCRHFRNAGGSLQDDVEGIWNHILLEDVRLGYSVELEALRYQKTKSYLLRQYGHVISKTVTRQSEGMVKPKRVMVLVDDRVGDIMCAALVFDTPTQAEAAMEICNQIRNSDHAEPISPGECTWSMCQPMLLPAIINPCAKQNLCQISARNLNGRAANVV